MIAIMSPDLTEQFAALPSERRSYAAGEQLFGRDTRVEWLHYVERGLIHLVRYKADGTMTVLQRAEAGYFLAEASLFSATYHCDGCAIAPTDVIRFPKPAVLAALGNRPDFAAAWSHYLSREVQRSRARAELLSLRRLSDRLDAWLDSRGGELPPKGQWVSVAREIGVSPEALYRYLGSSR